VRPLLTSYVWDLPVIVPEITAYRHHTVACPQCQAHVWQQRRPPGAPPGSFGSRITTAVGLLHGTYHLSDRKTQALCADLLRIDLSLRSVVASCLHVSPALAPVDAAILAVVQAQPVANVDETRLSFGTHSAAGSRFIERMRSVVTTARQQGWAVFAFLVDAVTASWAGAPAPILVAVP
jgi:hypothetical protein